MAGGILSELGLINGAPPSIPGRDFTQMDLLKLSQLKPATLLVVGEMPEQAGNMTKSPIWKALPVVKEGQLYNLPPLWSFGGPMSARRMTDAITQALLHMNSEGRV